MEALVGLGSGFGLSTSAGLNAYIPTLMVAVMTRLGLIELDAPYDALGSWWAIAALSGLLVVELFVDKIPVVDSINDVIQTVVRPGAGAILFAATADLDPTLSVILGIVLAGGVHTTKMATRPVVTAASAGTGNWLVSIVEDIVAFVVALLAILAPVVAAVLVMVFFVWVIRLYRRRRRRRRARAERRGPAPAG